MAESSGKTLLGRKPAPSEVVERILSQQPTTQTGPAVRPVDRAVLFTDIVGSTAYFEQRGDEAGLAMVERHNQLLFPLVEAHGGRVVKTIGDAIMAAYPDPAEAVRSAVAMQRSLAAHNAQQPDHERIRVRIGVNYGRVLSREADLFGDVVNAAARVEALASGGQVLISTAVAECLPGDFPEPCSLYDAVRVRGKQELIEVFEVAWDPQAKVQPIIARTQFEVGRVLGGRFEIISQLGEGGMGQVYEARDQALGEVVALKFVRADLAAEAETLERFKSEVRLARSVTHPNICRIHEFLEMDRRVFLSMERVRGKTLAELLATHPLPPERIAEVVSGICQGLQAAHTRGITHRDLKPANVMIEDDTGRVVLMDFGIAELAEASSGEADGTVLGTPEYMSPEQVQGQDVGPAADIYSLGVMLFQMLTGELPYQAKTPVAVAIQHLTAPLPRLEAQADQAAERIRQAALRCMAKRPKDRFPSAEAAAAEVMGEPPPHAAAPLRRRALFATAGLGLIAGIVTALALGLSGSGPGGPAASEWRARALVSSLAVEAMPRFSPDGRFLAFTREGDLWRLDSAGEPQRVTTGAEAIDAEGIASLAWSAGGDQLLFTGPGKTGLSVMRVSAFGGAPEEFVAGAVGAALSPDGKRLATCVQDEYGYTGIAISRSDGSQARVVLPGQADRSFFQPRWSPDGHELAIVVHQVGYESTRDIGLLDPDTGAMRLLTTDGAKAKVHNTDPTWTPEGDYIIYASKRDGQMGLWQVPVAGGASERLTRGAIADRRQPDVAPGGDRIAFSTHEEQLDIELIDLQTGNGRPITQDVWPDRFPVVSPDGRWVALRTQRRDKDPERRSIVLADLQSSDEKVLPGPVGLREMAWCGLDKLAYAATVEKVRLLGSLDLESGQFATLVDGFHRLWSPTCSPDGKLLVFVGIRRRGQPRQLWQYDLKAKALTRIGRERGRHGYPDFSPDGRTLAYRWAPSQAELSQAELQLLALRKGAKPRALTSAPSFRRSQRRLRFAPDGRAIYYMEATRNGGRLWRQPLSGGDPEPVHRFPHIHTFDYDLAPDGKTLIFPRVSLKGDLYLLEKQETE